MSSTLPFVPKIKKCTKISELHIDKQNKTYLFDNFTFFL